MNKISIHYRVVISVSPGRFFFPFAANPSINYCSLQTGTREEQAIKTEKLPTLQYSRTSRGQRWKPGYTTPQLDFATPRIYGHQRRRAETGGLTKN